MCGAVLCATVVALTFSGAAAGSQTDPTPDVLDYSGLGDSYSAGEGVTPYDLDTDTLENSCHRSENAYAHLIRAWLDAGWTTEGATEPFDSVDLDFLACSGALMRHVVPGVSLDEWPSECGRRRTGIPCGWFKTESPQLRRMEAWADLVTLTISGNDAHFADILKDCFAERDCRHSSPTWVPADPQNDTEECISRQDRDDYERFLDGVLGCLSDELTSTLTAIRERAPGAAVFVMSYPQLFPDTDDEQNCASLDYQGWQLKSTLGWNLGPYESNRSLAIAAVEAASGVTLDIPHFWQSRFAGSNFPFSNDEQVFLREKTLALNDMVEGAAADAGVHFVDVDPYFTNHEICGDGRGWMTGFVPIGRKNAGSDVGWKIWKKFSVPGSASFHPNALGHEAYATAFEDYVLRESCGDLLPSGLPANPPPGGGAVSTTTAPATSTSLVIDTSGSMGDWTGTGERKIGAARRAAHDVVTLAETDQTPTRRNQVGLVEFYTNAREVAPPTCGLGALRSRIDALYAEGDTDLGAGLQLGIDQVASSAGDKAVILLSDGVPTAGMTSEEVLATVVPNAVANDVRVFTVGFGRPGDPDELDEQLLQAIARRTGGEYGYASSPFGLRSVFIRARQSTTGDVVAEKKGMVAEGETQKAASWTVAEGEQGEMEIALAWPGSDLDIVLEDPSGEEVDADYEGVRISADQNPELVEVAAPATGRWTVRVVGKDVPLGIEEYYLVATTNEGTAPAEPRDLLPLVVGGGAALVAVIVGLAAWRMARARGRRRVLRVCPGCGTVGRGASTLCNACGTAMVPVCRSCKTPARSPQSAFCAACGTSLRAPEPRRGGRRRVVVACVLLLAGGAAAGIVFLQPDDGSRRVAEPPVAAVADRQPGSPAPLPDEGGVLTWRAGAARTAAYTAEGPGADPAVAWLVPTRDSVDSSAALAHGALYQGSDDGDIYALDQETGVELWRVETGGRVNSSPAVSDGRVIVGSYDGNVYSIDAATGEVLWTYETDDAVGSSPVVVDSYVLVGSDDGCVYSLSEEDGTEVWRTCTGGAVFSSPAVSGETAFVGSVDGNLYAIDAGTGEIVWTFSTGRRIVASPAVHDGIVYVGSKDGHMYALDERSGAQRWAFAAGSAVGSSPAVAQGRVYFGTYDGDVIALGAATGRELWRYRTHGLVFSSPAVVNGVVYVGSFDGYLRALDARGGDLIWRYKAGKWVNSTPAIHDGRIFVGSDEAITALS